MNTIKEFSVIALFKLLLSLFSFISFANAAFMVEPGFMVYNGDFNVSDRSGNLSAKVGSLNLGYMDEHFMVGVTLEKGDYTYDSNLTEDGYEEFDGGGIGTYIGFIFFDRIRIWTNYLNSTLEPKSNNDQRYFGQNFSYGIGFRVFKGLLLNYHLFSNQFTQIEDDATGKTQGLDSNIKTKGNSLSLSYILVF